MGDKKKFFDIVVIGGGTTGLFAAFYASMRDMSVKVIEANQELGGKVGLFFPEKQIYDIGGIPSISGDDLIKQMKDQASKHDPEIIVNEWVETIKKDSEGQFVLTCKSGDVHYAKTVLVSVGTGSFKVYGPIDDDSQKITNLHYTMQNHQQYHGKEVVILSPNRVGIDWALTLEPIVKRVILVNNKMNFLNASEEDLTRLANSTVEVHKDTSLKGFEEEGGKISSISLKSSNEWQVKVDDVFAYYGLKLESPPFTDWGIETVKGRITVDGNMSTTVSGIFAAGDSVNYQGKTMLIASGYTEVITAINSAKKFIEPDASNQAYSTVIYGKASKK